MPPPGSALFAVRPIDGAGRGVVASSSIVKDTEVLACQEPAAHVIFREYRKEVCAQCFLYDRGRTLPIRYNEIGKVFCSETCQSTWLSFTGEAGLEAWRRLTEFINTNSKHLKVSGQEILEGPKPSRGDISNAWANARLPARAAISGDSKKPAAISPDVLGFLLSAILTYHVRQDIWKHAMDLVLDEEPYKTFYELHTHCRSFFHLINLLPPELVDSCTEGVCLSIYTAASHNAFGIRSDGEDAEEYLGYAVYPQASFFNHSCAPSLYKQRIGRTWHFYAEIDMLVDEQLCISYLGGDERDLDVTERRERLSSVWDFVCQCSRCVVETESKEKHGGVHTGASA